MCIIDAASPAEQTFLIALEQADAELLSTGYRMQVFCTVCGLFKPYARTRLRPRPAGAALCLFPHPACCYWCLVCLCWRSCDSGERRRGGGCGAGPRRACLQLIDAGRSAPPFCKALLSVQRTPALRATGINTKNGVQGRGRGSSAGRWGRGRGKAVYARVHASTRANLVSRMCNIEDKCLKQVHPDDDCVCGRAPCGLGG